MGLAQVAGDKRIPGALRLIVFTAGAFNLNANRVANQEDLQALTDSYMSARYGDEAPSADDVAAAEDALAAIERTAPKQNTP